MLNTLLDLIKTKPKHYVKIVKGNAELLEWVDQHSLVNSDQLSAKIYSAVSGTNNLCSQGNVKQFAGINNGWKFCGKASVCACARQSVSEKCQTSANNRDWATVIDRRRKTNLEKYGHINVAQSADARKKHQEFYASDQNKQQAHERHKTTMMERYGVDNAAHLEHANEKRANTMLLKYGVVNPQQNATISQQTQATKKRKYDARHYIETSYDNMYTKFKQANYTLLTDKDSYAGVDQPNRVKYQFQHDTCGNKFETYIYSGHKPVCPACYYQPPAFVSGAETELADWVESLGVQVVRTEQQLIAPLHLDIYLPEHQLAIEYCGLYWHSQRANGKSEDYHKNKMRRCNAAGINLITIFEDEWLTKKDLVKSIICNRLGVSAKIGARTCAVAELSNVDIRDFVNANHLQAHVNATVNIALTHGDKIVSVMSFGKSRFNKRYQWELLRFCTQQGMAVTGGAEKIWDYFCKTHSPESIVSYCDLRWFTGAAYEKLGMTLLNETGPGYWYTDYKARFHRSNYTKQRLIAQGHDAELTEQQIMQDLNFDRIWDCGNRVYGLTLTDLNNIKDTENG
jgi:hypothetical protein